MSNVNKVDIEKLEIVSAAISRELYLAEVESDSTMNTDKRKVFTEEVLRAAAEWFIANDKTVAHFSGHGWVAWIPENENITSQEVKDYISNIKDLKSKKESDVDNND